ncbi:MAG: hypothetical protein FJ297_02145 [Planctomycetes bacterium]|nr:hypothetical protein [Planctomycetota bacterium]
MARENQRMQVGLIICIMLIVVLLTTTFLGLRSANELNARLAAATEQANRADTDKRQENFKVQYLSYMVGASATKLDAVEQAGLQMVPELQKVKDQFVQDMAQYGEGLADGERTYRSVCNNLVTVIRTANEQLANADGRVKQALADLNNRVDELTKRAAGAEAAQKAAEDKQMAELQTFNADRQKFVAQTQADATKISEMTAKVGEVEAAAAKREKELQQKIDEQDNRIVKLTDELNNVRQESFEVPDGRIVTVNQNEGYVWINVGRLDGLRAPAAFGVYEQSTNAIRFSKPKARIEVTRVLDDHLAEARIVNDQVKNPIVRGDLIYSPAWTAGMQVRFALAGFMDADGDGNSDRELVRNLIHGSNGKIDAEMQDDGKVTGTLEVGTRFLVLGDRPTDRDNPEVQKQFSALMDDAQRYGVEILKVGDLLNLMGWKLEARTVQLNEGTDTGDGFRPRTPEAPKRGTGGGAY